MENFSQKPKTTEKVHNTSSMQSRNIIETKLSLAVLKDLRDQVEELKSRIDQLEKRNKIVSVDTKKIQPDGQTNLMGGIQKEFEHIRSRLDEIEKKFDDRIPERILTESKFEKETQDSDEIVQKIISQIKNSLYIEPKSQDALESLTIVEKKRIEKIISLLERHEKLTSVELSQLIGLSRTRCNEYFKLMEKMGIAESLLVGKEKYYKLKR